MTRTTLESRAVSTTHIPSSGLGTAATSIAHVGTERALLDAAERAARAPIGKAALALHLSRLKNPAPRADHIRIALALMQDTAARLSGQVFPLRNGDLVLLCGGPEDAQLPSPIVLLESLRRLFGTDVPGGALTSVWRLDQEGSAFQAYIAHCVAGPAAPAGAPQAAGASFGLAALIERLEDIDPKMLLRQQTAVRLLPGRNLLLAARLAPLYRDILFTPEALQAGGTEPLLADPFILRHLALLAQPHILSVLVADLRDGGPLTRPALILGVPLHLALSPRAVVSPGFARLATQAARMGARFRVEFAATEVADDPDMTEFARGLLAQSGFDLVLGGIDHAGLAMLRRSLVSAALVKLDWSPSLADGTREHGNALSAAGRSAWCCGMRMARQPYRGARQAASPASKAPTWMRCRRPRASPCVRPHCPARCAIAPGVRWRWIKPAAPAAAIQACWT